MPRPPRIDFPGAWHHVMNRGARRAPIFLRDEHCLLFLECLHDAWQDTGLEVHAYALMPNHYHLLVRTPLGTLSRCMRQVNGQYTRRLNLLHGWDGPVFRGRFKSQLVQREEHLLHLLAYLHLNPLRAGLVHRLDSPAWTSHREYTGRERPSPWLQRAFLLSRLGGASGVEAHVLALHRKRHRWPESLDLESGWLDLEPTAATAVAPVRKAERVRPPSLASVLEAVCAITGADRDDLLLAERGPRANPARRFAAWALHATQVFGHAEIAAALDMPRSQVAKVLNRMQRRPQTTPVSDWMAAFRELGSWYLSSGNT